jgi:hypothetical protein
MDVPEMVLQDGSRAPALPASENRASQTPTHLVCSQRNSEMPFLFFFFFLLLVSSHFN